MGPLTPYRSKLFTLMEPTLDVWGSKHWEHFFLHSGMRMLLRIASMEVRSEGAKNIHWFWKILNQALREFTGDNDTMFNPSQIMVDENGANFCGVKEEFGLAYTLEKVVSCQMHFKADILKHMSKIGPSYKEEFWKCVCEVCITPTEARYNELMGMLYGFTEFYPEIKNILDFYDVRKYHLFPAFRRFRYSGVTLAESGWAKIKRSGQLWLLDAARDDISTMIVQCSDIKKYTEQEQDVIGDRAPNKAQKAAEARARQIDIAKKFAEEFENESAFDQHLKEFRAPKVFIPGPKAKHKAGREGRGRGRGKSVEGRFLGTHMRKSIGRVYGNKRGRGNGNGSGISTCDRSGGGSDRCGRRGGVRGAGRRRGRAKKVHNSTTSSSIEDILRRGEEILQEDSDQVEEANTSNGSDGRRGGYNPATNPPTIVLFLGKSISKCQGCFGTIERATLPPPEGYVLDNRGFQELLLPCRSNSKNKIWQYIFPFDHGLPEKEVP